MKPEDVLVFYGSPHKFARATGMSHTSLYNWLKWGFVPPEAQLKIQGFTGGQLRVNFDDVNTVKVKGVQRFTYYLTDEKEVIPCEPKKWLAQYELLSRDNKRCIGHEMIKGHLVLTVWSGLDIFFGLPNPTEAPLVFETVIFKGIDEIYCARYSGWEQAEKGHKWAKEWLIDCLTKKGKSNDI